jgi:4-amino-4-deoxy-L-arabinose transferase-like glycosyltransferase
MDTGFRVQTRHLLAMMTILQVLWLLFVWISGTASKWYKLPLLLVFSVVCSVGVGAVPTGIFSQSRQVTTRLLTKEHQPLVALCLGVFLVGVLYAYAQLGWPDEPFIFSASRIVAEQGVASFFAGYSKIPWLGNQHPPLAPLLYGGAMALLGVHLFVIRCVALVLSVFTLLLTYAIGRELYSHRIGLLAALFFVSTPFFFRIGTTGLTDMLTAFCFILGVFLMFRLVEKPTYKLAVAVGLCLGIGLLCRYTMVFIYPLLLGVVVIRGLGRRLLGHLLVVLLISGGMLAIWFCYAASTGVLAVQWKTLTYSAGFVAKTAMGRTREEGWIAGALLFRVPSGIGVANFPLLLLGAWCLCQRRNLSDVSLLLWIVAVGFPLVLTLPGPRYFLPAFPALAMMMAWGLERVDGEEAASRVVLLSLLYTAGALYLFLDWYRAAGDLFVR